MSLDQNLFTLQVKPSETDPTIVDLVETTGNVLYRKQRISGPVYAARVYDFVSQSLLVTATAPSPTSKVKILELQNPSVPVELKASGTFTVKWIFKWEEHEFEWKREECYMIRKPDPPVLVAISKEIPGRVKSAAIQVLDYNLNRFDIEDRKGLELVILTALLTFLDVANSKEDEPVTGRQKSTWTTLSPFGISKSPPTNTLAPPSKDESLSTPQNVRARVSSSPGLRSTTMPLPHDHSSALRHSTPVPIPISHPATSTAAPPPTPPPTPPSVPVHPSRISDPPTSPVSSRGTRRTDAGLDRIAQMHALRSVVHEVTVYEDGSIDDYAKFCWRMLKDEAMSFITIRSANSSQVQKVLEVIEATKGIRFRKGPYIELLQFVTYYPLPVGTTQQRLEERARLLSMTPKQVKKAQKQKEKEEKKRMAKAKKAKGAIVNVMTLEVEEIQIPPKSVHVRLTKVEIQNPLLTVNVVEEKGKGKKVPKLEITPSPDPRFLVQKAPSDIPSRYTTLEKGKNRESISVTPTDLRQRTNLPIIERRAASEVRSSDHPSGSSQAIPKPSSHTLKTPSPAIGGGLSNVLHSSASQPSLTVAHHPKVPRSRSDTEKYLLHALSSTSVSSTPDVGPSKKAPALPPRQSSKNLIKAKVADSGKGPIGPIAGSSQLGADAPPSYTDLPTEGEFPVDLKH